ncbi:hypothetical protein AAG906_014593 [Vitis piasezkii]
MKLEHFIRKLQLVLSLVPSKRMVVQDDVEYDEELEAATMVPDDVKEGHFAVWAVMGGEPKRFIVDLCYLTNPAFLRLLEQAEEEYGFEQKELLQSLVNRKSYRRFCNPGESQLQWLEGGLPVNYNAITRQSCKKNIYIYSCILLDSFSKLVVLGFLEQV